ncbi:MAG: hypothetical protein AAFN93_14540 [Bacteroidota bacterium]
MKSVIIVLLGICLVSCGGSLNEEQREALKAEKNAKMIKKVSEDEIYQKALITGKEIMSKMNEGMVIGDIESQYKAEILRVNDSTPGLNEKEVELWEVYKNNDWTNSPAEDNVQKNGPDDLIYTSPVLGEEGDSLYLSGLWVVRMKRKEIVLAL